jgi:alkylation response protein AidB-like acyl-CoA dehydrogenase
MAVLDGLGYGCRDAGLLFSINAHLWSSVIPLWRHGTPAQRERYLIPLVKGEMVGLHAMTEPSSGSDAFALQTRARRVGDRFVLDGRKMFITNAPIAHVFIIFARLEGTEGSEGITAFLLDRGAPGLVVGKPMDKMGLRTSPMAELALEGCEVTRDAVVGRPGAGAAIFNGSMLWERACIMAPLVGAMQRQLDVCVAYARQRRQFGKSIGRFESVSEKVADMKVRVDTARAILYRTGAAMDSGRGGLLEASVSKLYISEAAVAVHRDAIQIHGGYGYITDLGVERELRDVLGSTIYSGTSEMQRYIIGRLIGL